MARNKGAVDRREFFRHGGRKVAEAKAQVATATVAARAGNWIRPPFAVAEAEFLLGCTRCGKCAEVCLHDVIFELPGNLGRQVAGTPAMDLRHRGCHMCADWPCLAACEPKVLKRSEPKEDSPPAPLKLAVLQIDERTCLPYLGSECGACAHACPVPGALEWEDGVGPVIVQKICTGCALCREACILEPKAIEISVYTPEDAAVNS